jgi:hypothetical protein
MDIAKRRMTPQRHRLLASGCLTFVGALLTIVADGKTGEQP